MNKRIAVFSASKPGRLAEYAKLAYDLGAELTKAGYGVVNGGGLGLMEAVARGVVEHGGQMTSVRFEHEGAKHHEHAHEVHSFESLMPRQAKLVEIADGYLVLPGGIGTLYEAVEILAKKQAKEMPYDVPLIFIGEYWKIQFEMVKRIVAEEFAGQKVLEYYNVVYSPKETVELLDRKFG